jgi:Transcription factor WhiB
MDLASLMTGGLALSDQELWALVRAQGTCSTSGLSPDDWYPVSATAAAARCEAAAAVAVCAACPVRAGCLELALRNWTVGRFGVWGGTVPAERANIRAGRVMQLIRVLDRAARSDD